MNEERKGWLNSTTLVPMIPTTIVALAAVFWIFQDIATQSDLNLVRNDFNRRFDQVDKRFELIDKRLDKLDRDFEYIRDNMVTKADIQQIQVEIARNRRRLDEHLTLHHNSSEP